MAYILMVCGEYVTEALRATKEAATYFAEQGNRVVVITGGEAAERALIEEAPDILVSTEWIPPRDVFHLTTALREHHRGSKTQVILLVHTTGAHGEPCRYWPQLFHSYVIMAGGKWQIILAVEQLLKLKVTGVTGVLPATYS